VYNRTDCCERWRKDFYVFVSDDKISGAFLDLESAKAQAREHFHYLVREAADSFTWKVPAKTRGRYVMVMTTPEEKNIFNAEKAKLDKQFSDLKSEIASTNNQINQAEREISDSEKTILDAEKRIPSIEKEIANAEKTISDSKKQLPVIESQIVINSAIPFGAGARRVSELKSQKFALEKQITDSAKQITILTKEKSELEKQKSDSKDQIAKLKKDQANLQEQMVGLEKDNNALAEKVATFDKEAENSFLSLAEVEVFSP
jgi:chromosome segregation ATPase